MKPESNRCWCIPQNVWVGLVVLAICVFSFAVRTINWHNVFVGNEVRLVENDAYYHMRRVHLAVTHHLSVPEYDTYMNFPAGLHCNWPPLFDQLIAATAMSIGCVHPSEHLIDSVGALIPPILGMITVLAVYLITAFLFGKKPALLAAFVFSLLPYHIQVSVLGRPDHHVAVVLLSSFLFRTVMHLTTVHRTRDVAAFSLIGGLLLGASLATWVGSLLFVGGLLATFAALIFLNRRDERKLDLLLFSGAAVFVIAAWFLCPFVWPAHWHVADQASWDVLSSRHVFLLVCCVLALVIERTAIHLFLIPNSISSSLRWKYVMWLIMFSAVLVIILARNGIIQSMTDAPRWFLKHDPLMRQVYESNPLTLRSAMENFTGLAVLLPVILLMACRHLWKEERKEAAVLLMIWTLITGIGAIIQERFSDIFSVNAAVLIGGLPAIALAKIRGKELESGTDQPQAKMPIIIVLLVLFALASWPTLKWLNFYSHKARSTHTERNMVYEMCQWLRDNTPAQAGYSLDGRERPHYSVLAGWPLGNAIASIGRRANVANNFVGWNENREANLTPYRFFVSTNAVEARKLLDSRSVRYVIVEEPIASGYLALMANTLGLNRADFFDKRIGSAGPVYSPNRRALECMATRLYLSTNDPPDGFTLVYESKEKATAANRYISVLRVFEYSGGKD